MSPKPTIAKKSAKQLQLEISKYEEIIKNLCIERDDLEREEGRGSMMKKLAKAKLYKITYQVKVERPCRTKFVFALSSRDAEEWADENIESCDVVEWEWAIEASPINSTTSLGSKKPAISFEIEDILDDADIDESQFRSSVMSRLCKGGDKHESK